MGAVAAVVAVSGAGRVTPPAPTFSKPATGQFQISNYSPLNTYTLTLVSGSGTASLNTSTGVVTLSGADSRYSVRAKGPKQMLSALGYVERKSYTYSPVNQPYACGSYSCNCSTSWGACGCGSCAGYPSPNGQSWGQCGCPGDMCWYNPQTSCQTCTTYCDNWVNVKNATPSGYTDSQGEWWKIT